MGTAVGLWFVDSMQRGFLSWGGFFMEYGWFDLILSGCLEGDLINLEGGGKRCGR